MRVSTALAICLICRAAAADGASEWLARARTAVQELQGYITGPAAPPASDVTDALVEALAATHKHVAAAQGQRDPAGDAAAREIHQALLQLAYAKATYGNLTELEEELPVGVRLGLVGFENAQRCLSEASFAGHGLKVAIKAPVGAGGTATVEVNLANAGRRRLKAPRVTLAGPEGWTCQPQGKWVFSELAPGDSHTVVFAVKPEPGGAEAAGRVTARISYFVYAGRAVVEREQEVRVR
jgi:hypothetical protein